MDSREASRYWRGLRYRKWTILGTTLLGVAASWFLAFHVAKPKYQATTSILINQPKTSTAVLYDSILANQALINTYTDIIRSSSLEEQVIQALHLPYSTTQLKHMLQVSTPNQSQIIDISALAPSQPQAVAIVNQTAIAFQKTAAQLMGLQNVQVVDRASILPHPLPAKPDKKLDLAAGFLAGLTLGVLFALILERFDQRIKSEDEAQEFFQVPVLGVIIDYK